MIQLHMKLMVNILMMMLIQIAIIIYDLIAGSDREAYDIIAEKKTIDLCW